MFGLLDSIRQLIANIFHYSLLFIGNPDPKEVRNIPLCLPETVQHAEPEEEEGEQEGGLKEGINYPGLQRMCL